MDARSLWNMKYGKQCIPQNLNSQHEWDELHCKQVTETFKLVNDSEKALYLASLEKESNAWFHTHPSRAVGFWNSDG